MMTDIRATAQKALRSLGTDPDEIADSLRLRGITGYQRCSTKCIIANYLEVETGEPWVVGGGAHTLNDLNTFIFLGSGMRAFINRFDAGHYPDLETPRPVHPSPWKILVTA